MNFEVKNFIVKNDLEKKTLMLECNNLIDSMDEGLYIIEVNVQ